jgi:hypothetical protein
LGAFLQGAFLQAAILHAHGAFLQGALIMGAFFLASLFEVTPLFQTDWIWLFEESWLVVVNITVVHSS